MSQSLLQTMRVVIPCYNAARTLPRTLTALADQSLPPEQFEVIVVDDGSTDGSQEAASRLDLPYPIHTLQQRHRGAAAARNAGAANTQADVLLFIDADIILSSRCLEEHLTAHRVHPRSLVAGRVDPSPEMPITDTASWIEHKLGDPRTAHLRKRTEVPDCLEIPYHDAWSNNLSVERSDFEQIGGFDEGFYPGAGYEDVEFSFRATQHGLTVLYRPAAWGFHDHPRTLDDHLQRSLHYIRWGNYLLAKHPELRGRVPSLCALEPINWKQDSLPLIRIKMKYRFWGFAPVLWLLRVTLKAMQKRCPQTLVAKNLYWRLIKGYSFVGFREGLEA